MSKQKTRLRLFPKGQGPQGRKTKSALGASPAQASEVLGGVAVAEAALEDKGYRSVAVTDILSEDDNHRDGPLDVSDLVDSIRREGLLQPVLLAAEDGRYHLLAGRRRLAAVKMLGWDIVPAHILKCPGEDRAEALAAVENLERRDLTPVEEGLAVARLLETLGAKREDLERGAASAEAIERAAALLGRSPAWVKDRGLLLRLCPKVRALVADGRLPLGQAREIAKLVSEKDQHEVALIALGFYPSYQSKIGPMAEGFRVISVRAVRRAVAERLATLRGVPWEPDVDFAGRPACVTCPENSANCLLFGGDDDKAPEARCLNTACYAAKMKAAEKALAETVKKAKANPRIQPTAASVFGVGPEYLKPATVARNLARARGIEPKKGKAGPGAPGEKKKSPITSGRT